MRCLAVCQTELTCRLLHAVLSPRVELELVVEGRALARRLHADLLGLPVVTDAGEAVGTVLAIENFGATDIIEITRAPVPEKGPKTFMVPLIPAAVLEWDEHRLVIAAGFAED